MIMSAVDLLNTVPNPSEGEIRSWLEGNLCRCAGYHSIVEAVRAGLRLAPGAVLDSADRLG